jgi:hypothetical protein
LEKTQAEEIQNITAGPANDALTAAELIALSNCKDLTCIQLFMKHHANDFVHAQKGEFAALHRSVVIDTAGNELIIPLSTLYIDVNPQANWRMAHTLHRKELGDHLLEEFQTLGFQLVDSGYYTGVKGKQALYHSTGYPGKNLYITATFQPWYFKGLYQKVSWPCWVFEVYQDY